MDKLLKGEYLVLHNAKIYDETFTHSQITNIVIKERRFFYIGNNVSSISKNPDATIIDLKGKLVLLPFCDHHLHLPGAKMYNLHGLNIAECETGEDYKNILVKESKNKELKLFKAFGWEVVVLKKYFESVDYTPLQLIDNLFPDKPAIIFSEDLHSCWCNTIAMKYLSDRNITCGFRDDEIKGGHECIFHERVVDTITSIEKLTFTYAEVEDSMLDMQQELLSYGITQVNTMMFSGVTSNHGLRVLSDLNQERQLSINVNCCFDVYPEYSIQEIKNQIAYRKRFVSHKVKFGCFKIFVDGVIDNHSAALSENYSDQATNGQLNWDRDRLISIVALSYEYDLPIHAHVIGDRAAEEIVNILALFPKRTKNRHVLTHLQVCKDETIKKMSELGIVACLQPFWFERGKNAIEIDKTRLGNRVDNQYKAQSFINNNVRLVFASDCPITPDYRPITGIKYATKVDGSGENISMVDAYKAFCINAYSGKKCAIKVGERADFIVLSNDIFKDGIQDDTCVEKTYIGGDCVYHK